MELQRLRFLGLLLTVYRYHCQLFSWSKPLLVISGIDKGSSFGHHVFPSGSVAGAREALLCGVPSISISLNWKKDESQESLFREAVSGSLPLINAAGRTFRTGHSPKVVCGM